MADKNIPQVIFSTQGIFDFLRKNLKIKINRESDYYEHETVEVMLKLKNPKTGNMEIIDRDSCSL